MCAHASNHTGVPACNCRARQARARLTRDGAFLPGAAQVLSHELLERRRQLHGTQLAQQAAGEGAGGAVEQGQRRALPPRRPAGAQQAPLGRARLSASKARQCAAADASRRTLLSFLVVFTTLMHSFTVHCRTKCGGSLSQSACLTTRMSFAPSGHRVSGFAAAGGCSAAMASAGSGAGAAARSWWRGVAHARLWGRHRGGAHQACPCAPPSPAAQPAPRHPSRAACFAVCGPPRSRCACHSARAGGDGGGGSARARGAAALHWQQRLNDSWALTRLARSTARGRRPSSSGNPHTPDSCSDPSSFAQRGSAQTALRAHGRRVMLHWPGSLVLRATNMRGLPACMRILQPHLPRPAAQTPLHPTWRHLPASRRRGELACLPRRRRGRLAGMATTQPAQLHNAQARTGGRAGGLTA